jgi:hypothetical protein
MNGVHHPHCETKFRTGLYDKLDRIQTDLQVLILSMGAVQKALGSENPEPKKDEPKKLKK